MNIDTKILIWIILLSAISSDLCALNTYSDQADSTVQTVNDSSATKPTLNINLWAGLISNSTFGIHPLINLSAGIGSPSDYFVLEYEHRYGHSKNNYQTVDDNRSQTVNAYNSSYVGLGYQRRVVSDKELYAKIGIGNDWIVVDKSDFIKKSKTLHGIAFNAGVGYTYYFEANHGPSIQILYHYADISNQGGTAFDQSSVVIRICYLFGKEF